VRQWAALTNPAALAVSDPPTEAPAQQPGPPASATLSSSRSIGKPAAAASRILGGGSSWYTDSDSDDDDGFLRGVASSSGLAGGGKVAAAAGNSRLSVSSDKPRRIPKRVRATALHCLQALAKQDARLVASRWSLCVPEVQGCHSAPFQPSVLTVMLFDPSMRVRWITDIT
jgi:hypothetical protein